MINGVINRPNTWKINIGWKLTSLNMGFDITIIDYDYIIVIVRLEKKRKQCPMSSGHPGVTCFKSWMPTVFTGFSTAPGLEHGLALRVAVPLPQPPTKKKKLQRLEGWKGVIQIHLPGRLIALFGARPARPALWLPSSRIVVPFHRRHILLGKRQVDIGSGSHMRLLHQHPR